MTITPLALTNPGAETGDTTGWTLRSGSGFVAVTSQGGETPHSGSYFFKAGASATSVWDQTVDVSAYATEIDAGSAAVRVNAYHSSWPSDNDNGALTIAAYAADGSTLLGSTTDTATSPDGWVKEVHAFVLPAGTRYVRIGTTNTRTNGSNLDSYWDDFAPEISDDYTVDFAYELGDAGATHQAAVYALVSGGEPRLHQVAAYALVSLPAEELRSLQAPLLLMGAAETSTGEHDVVLQQVVGYALVKRNLEVNRVRAWTFPQDDHNFYVLHLGDIRTFVWDALTNQWAHWKSVGTNTWRCNIGLDWDGENIAGDVLSGVIWDIDPIERSDDDVTGLAEGRTPIQTVVRGIIPYRLLDALGCFRAVLTVSQGSPVEAGVGIQLRTSDDFGTSWQDQGTLTLDVGGTFYDVAWPSLGVITAPGRIFEIIDTGYARRIDGLDVDLGPEEGGGNG